MIEVERLAEKLAELRSAQRRVVQIGDPGALPLDPLDGRSDQGRLPGPRLADEQRQPTPAAQAVLQVAQGLAMLAGEQEKSRIRCQVERPFPQSEECFVHYRIQSVR